MRLWCLALLTVFFACEDAPSEDDPSAYTLIRKSDTLFFLNLKKKPLQNAWELNYPVFQIDEGDVDRDGKVDALVGVFKSTHFDSIQRKRLFIFKNHKGYVRPLWLGSRLANLLEDFRFVELKKTAVYNYLRNGVFW